jgi:superfamily II DNA or RNA helicase
MDDWREYERVACIEHARRTNHTVLGWNDIPHEWLLDSGFVNDINRFRIRRKESGGNIREYGLDGLALDPSGVFHGLQMKCWGPARLLRAEDICTFQSVVSNRLQIKNKDSVGHLYHTCKLQADLRDDLIYSGRIIAHRFIPSEPVQVFAEFELPSEASYVLRDYQNEALKAMKEFDFEESPFGVLTMPCGTGKTLVCGRYIAERKPDIVIFIAPLIALVEQNLTRLRAFVPDYRVVRVHSGPEGTTNSSELAEVMKSGRILVGATYDSFVDVVATLDFSEQDVLVIVDEAHNIITDNARVRTALGEFERVLLVTATPPSAFEDFASEAYTYNLGTAITNKFVCDYNIWVPDIVRNPVRFPDDFSGFEGDLAGKALYLINNMLLKGARRCIAYLTSHEEVVAFRSLIERVAREYHSAPVWTGEIISTTRSRDDVFAQFQATDPSALDKLYVLCSIRILDEGIDLPKCDSVFVSNVSEQSSSIRMVQRMCRANRLDPDRPNKTSHVFLWNTDEFVKIVHVLDGLRDVDPEYIKKIRTASSGYVSESSEIRTERVRVETGELEAYESVRAVSLEERALAKAREVVAFWKEHGRFPSPKSSLGMWLYQMRKVAHGKKSASILFETVRDYLSREIPQWCPDVLRGETNALKNANEVILYYSTEGKLPPRCVRLGRWLDNMRQSLKNDDGNRLLYPSVKRLLDEHIPFWCWDKEKIAMSKAEEFVAYFKTNGQHPPRSSKLGRWFQNLRKACRGKCSCIVYDSVRAFLDAEIPGWYS